MTNREHLLNLKRIREEKFKASIKASEELTAQYKLYDGFTDLVMPIKEKYFTNEKDSYQAYLDSQQDFKKFQRDFGNRLNDEYIPN